MSLSNNDKAIGNQGATAKSALKYGPVIFQAEELLRFPEVTGLEGYLDLPLPDDGTKRCRNPPPNVVDTCSGMLPGGSHDAHIVLRRCTKQGAQGVENQED